uniref:Uncharacterized protein n=1 Tax=Arundo donax TaxID=35708 RepID=A0A0A9D768_ARUDO
MMKCVETRPAYSNTVLENILISMSSQHIRNQAVCEQSHLSRITYYGYFDTSLGRYCMIFYLIRSYILIIY